MKQLFLGGISLGVPSSISSWLSEAFSGKFWGEKKDAAGIRRCLHRCSDFSFTTVSLKSWLCP